MDYLEKPPVNKAWLIFKCITVPVLLLASLLLGSVALTSAKRFETAKGNPLVLEVKVTYVDVDIDADNGDDYNAMVEYVYNGVKYPSITMRQLMLRSLRTFLCSSRSRVVSVLERLSSLLTTQWSRILVIS